MAIVSELVVDTEGQAVKTNAPYFIVTSHYQTILSLYEVIFIGPEPVMLPQEWPNVKIFDTTIKDNDWATMGWCSFGNPFKFLNNYIFKDFLEFKFYVNQLTKLLQEDIVAFNQVKDHSVICDRFFLQEQQRAFVEYQRKFHKWKKRQESKQINLKHYRIQTSDFLREDFS